MSAYFPGRFPTEILAELERVPVGLLEEMTEARAFDAAYAAVKRDPAVQGDELMQTAKELMFEAAQAELTRKGLL